MHRSYSRRRSRRRCRNARWCSRPRTVHDGERLSREHLCLHLVMDLQMRAGRRRGGRVIWSERRRRRSCSGRIMPTKPMCAASFPHRAGGRGLRLHPQVGVGGPPAPRAALDLHREPVRHRSRDPHRPAEGVRPLPGRHRRGIRGAVRSGARAHRSRHRPGGAISRCAACRTACSSSTTSSGSTNPVADQADEIFNLRTRALASRSCASSSTEPLSNRPSSKLAQWLARQGRH